MIHAMENQTNFLGKKSKNTTDQKALLKAHNKSINGAKLIKKGGSYSDTPLFKKDIQTSLF